MTEKEELLQLRKRVAELEKTLELKDRLDHMHKKLLENLEHEGHIVADPSTGDYYDVNSLEGIAAKQLKNRINNLEMPSIQDLYSEFNVYSEEQASNKLTQNKWKEKSTLERYKAFVNSERFLPVGIYKLNNLVNMIITAGRSYQMAEAVRAAGGDAAHWEKYVLDPQNVSNTENKKDVKVEVNGRAIIIQIDESMYSTSGSGIEIYLEA